MNSQRSAGNSEASEDAERTRSSCPSVESRFPTLSMTSDSEDGSSPGENNSGSTPLYTTEVRQPRPMPSSTCSRALSLPQITRLDEEYTRRVMRRHHAPTRPLTCTVEEASWPWTDTTYGMPSSWLSNKAAWPQGNDAWAWIRSISCK